MSPGNPQTPPQAPPQDRKIRCPKCKHVQPVKPICENCGFNIRQYALDLKRGSATPGQKGAVPSPEKTPAAPEIKGPVAPPPQAPLPEKPAAASEEKGPDAPPAEPEAVQKLPPPQHERTVYQFPVYEREADISGIGELFGKAWDVYKRRFLTLMLLIILTVFMTALSIGLPVGAGLLMTLALPSGKGVFIASGILLAAALAPIALSWGSMAFVFATADEDLGIKDSLWRGRKKVWSFMWLGTVLSFVLFGAYLLFLIPGVIFTVWFAFAVYVLAVEDRRGMDAALKSREYVRGRWGDVFVRLFVLGIASTALGFAPLVGPLLSFLFVPFSALYTFLIYKELREIREIIYTPTSGQKCKWVAVGALGYLVAPIIIIMVMGAFVMSMFGALSAVLLSKSLPGGLPGLQLPWAKTELDGVWAGYREGGFIDGRDIMVKFAGSDMEFVSASGAVKGIITLDEKAEPKQIDIVLTETPDGRYIGQTSLGIYMMSEGTEGEELKICASEPGAGERPASFTHGGDVVCLSLTRWKESEEELRGQVKPVKFWDGQGEGLAVSPDMELPTMMEGPPATEEVPATPIIEVPAAPGTELDGSWSDREITLSFSGNNVAFESVREKAKGVMTLNPNASPKQLDVLMTETPGGRDAGKTSLGIYKIEGARLTYCSNEPGRDERPKSFIPEGKVACLTLTRVRGAPKAAR